MNCGKTSTDILWKGKVLTAMTAYSYKQFYPVTVVTEKNVYEADFKTYVQTGIGNDMFYLPPVLQRRAYRIGLFAFRHQWLGGTHYGERKIL